MKPAANIKIVQKPKWRMERHGNFFRTISRWRRRHFLCDADFRCWLLQYWSRIMRKKSIFSLSPRKFQSLRSFCTDARTIISVFIFFFFAFRSGKIYFSFGTNKGRVGNHIRFCFLFFRCFLLFLSNKFEALAQSHNQHLYPIEEKDKIGNQKMRITNFLP